MPPPKPPAHPGPAIDGALVWLRRDLRLVDNAALHHALRAARQVWCVFVFDRDILDALPRFDRRVAFIHASVAELDRELQALGRRHGRLGVRLLVRHGHAVDAVAALAGALGVQTVYASHDDDPAALARDAAVRRALAEAGIALHTGKDHVIFERSEVLTQAGTPYGVYTPYRNAWLKKLEPFFVKAYPVEPHAAALADVPPSLATEAPSLAAIGFEPVDLAALGVTPGSAGGSALLHEFLHRIDAYGTERNYPATDGTSRLSVHLRFGTVSIRELAAAAWQRSGAAPDRPEGGASVWLSELIWRDFYHQILHHRPHVVGHAYKPAYDRIVFAHGTEADRRFAAWCEGRTGYPLIDAAMAQINRTGFMHNRLRMVTASFLVKDLGIDWRRGEAYFAEHLIDYELASNNGGWQWAASTGSDAQPYFRVFNPVAQSQRFDAGGDFIRAYVPALAGLPAPWIHAPWQARPADLRQAGIELDRDYPRPIVDHETARAETLARYAVVRAGG